VPRALATVSESVAGRDLAARAWRLLNARGPDPRSVVYLGGTPTASSVYRLAGVGPAGTSVIAKQGPRRDLVAECTVYEAVLPELGVPALRCHGLLADDGEGLSWLFLEDAGDRPYLHSAHEHRLLAARWLGVVHAGAAGGAFRRLLPDCGPGCHRARLRDARAALATWLPEAAPRTRVRVERIIRRLAALDDRWRELAEVCSWVAPTLTHGDLVARNMRLRSVGGRAALMVFDWEVAGWGSPAIDLRRFAGGRAAPETRAYLRLVAATYPELDEERLRVLAETGTVLRAIDSMYWATTKFEDGGFVWECLNLQIYDRRLARAMTSLGWAGGGSAGQ
jgi:hypothetical protein